MIVSIVAVAHFAASERKESVGAQEPSATAEPREQAFTSSDEEAIRAYLTDSIRDYAPEEPVLGGSWYTTDIALGGDRALVWYEDGHIARAALVDLSVSQDAIGIVSVLPAYTDERETITASLGTQFVIALTSSPGTGYRWNESNLSEAVALKGEGFLPPSDSSLVGAGGIQYAVYEATALGSDRVTLTYARPWESVQPLLMKLFAIEVRQ